MGTSTRDIIMWKYLLPFLFNLSYITYGLYFHIGETERKCFIEEIPDETMVTGNYKVQLYDPRTNGFAASSPEIGMHVEIRDPDDKIILSKWYSGTQLRVHLDIQVGEHAIDYANVA